MIKPPYTKWINDIKTKLGFNRTMTASGEDVVDAVNKQSQQITNLQAADAIIVNGDTATQAVPAGSYAYIKNNTHGLSEGLYRNKTGSAFPTSGGTANNTVFEAVSNGGLNAVADMYKVVMKTSSDITCAAGDYGGVGSTVIDIIESGYTAIGLLGINTHGAGSARITIYGSVSNNYVAVRYQNYSNLEITFNFDLYILYRKNV